VRFRVRLMDPFGTVIGRGVITTEGSVFDLGIYQNARVSVPLTKTERKQQIAQIIDQGRYVQPVRVAYSVDVMAMEDDDGDAG
jgi:hypothetical protein